MNYTKEEWKARPSGITKEPYYVETEDKTIAHIWGLRDKAEPKANAHLIAAAPDMYEALKRITTIEQNDAPYDKYDVLEAIHIAKQALAKAEGK